ncbi:Uncharacterized protein TCM_042335 [Theobroma cacao]|uniref:Uncharacterized protein n=1 Tax=Theobroma cacao TaxID=3641 RepID=A0A061FKS7_THECC|nr:Uncharacterized protein TCM_042335 [Theobroma cacao]
MSSFSIPIFSIYRWTLSSLFKNLTFLSHATRWQLEEFLFLSAVIGYETQSFPFAEPLSLPLNRLVPSLYIPLLPFAGRRLSLFIPMPAVRISLLYLFLSSTASPKLHISLPKTDDSKAQILIPLNRQHFPKAFTQPAALPKPKNPSPKIKIHP